MRGAGTSLRLHVLAGPAGLLSPAPLGPELAAALFGAGVRLPCARWLEEAAPPHHDYLRTDVGDGRIPAFARTLRQDFGSRFAPLLVLPDLLAEVAPADAAAPRQDADAEAPAARLPGLAVIEALWAEGAADRVCLAALALPADPPGEIWQGMETLLAPGVSAALAAVASACVARGVPEAALETRLIEVGPAPGIGATPWRNALAARLARHLERRLAAEALALDPDAAPAALVRLLELWSRAGIAPAAAPGRAGFERLADRALAGLLAGAADG